MKPLQVVEKWGLPWNVGEFGIAEQIRIPSSSRGGEMHELVSLYLSWSGTLYVWARTAVGILLWFWVVSGALFALRFLAYMLMDRNNGGSPLVAASARMPFSIVRFRGKSRLDSSQE